MTVDTLEQFRELRAEIKSISATIEAVYDTRRSPNGREPGGNLSTPVSPTERAVANAIRLKEKKARMMEEWERAVHEIETWLDTVTDADIRSIVRYRYVLGYSWKRTNREIYGADNYYRARKKFYRFMGKC